jgi:hypothetical protein
LGEPVPEESKSSEEEKSVEDDSSPERILATPVSRDRVVYLTADSSEVLEELKEGETYIIGGICDHNRYKVRRPHHQGKIFMDASAEPLSGQSQGIGSPCGTAPHWAISIASTNKKGPHSEPGFRNSR